MKNILEGFASALSFNLGTYFGAPLKIHWSWTLFMLFMLPQPHFGLILAAFAFVILHEYGHVFAARCVGIPCKEVSIYPIGGVASIDMAPNRPREEFIVTVAGPMVNVVLAFLFLPAWIICLNNGWEAVSKYLLMAVIINASLVIFNVIPAWPLDGGRILRSSLAFVMDYRTATWLAVRASQVLCIFLFVTAIYASMLMLAIICPLIALAAQAELERIRSHEFYVRLRPIFRLAKEGKYPEALLQTGTLPEDSRVRIIRLVELMKQTKDTDLGNDLLTVLEKEFPSGPEVREQMVEMEIAGLRKLSADVDKILTAVEQRKSVEEIEEIVETMTDEDFKSHCRKLITEMRAGKAEQ
jgi:Zn-dependent protease